MTPYPFPPHIDSKNIYKDDPRKYWEQIMNILIAKGFEIKTSYFATGNGWGLDSRWLQIYAFNMKKGLLVDIHNNTYHLGEKVDSGHIKILYRGTDDRTFILELMIALLELNHEPTK